MTVLYLWGKCFGYPCFPAPALSKQILCKDPENIIPNLKKIPYNSFSIWLQGYICCVFILAVYIWLLIAVYTSL